MDYLNKMNIKVQPLTHQNTQKIFDFMMQSFRNSILVQKKIQTFQVMRQKSWALFSQLLKVEDQLNKAWNTKIQYCTSYTLNGEIIAFILVIDFVKLLKVIDEIEQDYYYELLRNHGQKIQLGRDIFFGKVTVTQKYKNKGIAKFIFLERFQYLYKNGYKTAFGVGTNPHMGQHNTNIGGRVGYTMDVKLPDNTYHKMPIILSDIKTAIQGTKKRQQKKKQITAKL